MDKANHTDGGKNTHPIGRSCLNTAMQPDRGGTVTQQSGGNLALQRYFVQAKLALSHPDDPYEQEADRVADQVMRKPADDQRVSVSPLSQGVYRKCAACATDEESQTADAVQRKTQAGSFHAGASGVSSHAIKSATQGGKALSRQARTFFEPRFGRSFSNVKVHTGGYSNQVAQALHAKAFTAGNNIVFASGQYQPENRSGRHLLAHELAHVVQQGQSIPRPVASLSNISQQVQRKKDAAADTPSDITESVTFAGHILTKDGKQLMGVLTKITLKEGLDNAKSFVEKFAGTSSAPAKPVQSANDGSGGAGGSGSADGTGGGRGAGSESSFEQEIKTELRRQYQILDGKAKKLIKGFESHAFNVINEMLFSSEAKLQAESEKYGLKPEGVKGNTFMSDSVRAPGAPVGDGRMNYSLQENSSTEGMRDAARRLWPLRHELDQLTKKRDRLVHRVVSNNEGPMPRFVISNQAQYDSLSQQIKEKAPAYEKARAEHVGAFPVLAAFAGPGGAAALQRISQGSTGAANTVGELITQQLENIEKVRNALGDGELEIWSVPTVVKGTKMSLAFTPGTLGAKLVDDQVSELALGNALSAAAISAVAIALGLIAAIPTAGASMGVALTVSAAAMSSAALSVYLAGDSLQQYELAQAMTGTDPDKARAISQNEPSMFWLALEIVGAILDVAQAAKVFKQLLTMQRAVAALPPGTAGAAADSTTQALRQAGNRVRQGVGDRLVSEAVSGAGSASRTTDAVRAAETAEDYLTAIRGQGAGNNVRWDHGRFPSAPRGSKWQLGDPIDMPSTRGGYPTYDTARKRYWKNRAHAEMQARSAGQAAQDASAVDDPLRVLSDDDLRRMADSGGAPVHPITGRKMELEHAGVPQRVERWLQGLGFSAEEARRLADVSNPHALMEVEPLEHAFFDAEAWKFGRLRADVDGARWTGTLAADPRMQRPLVFMSDADFSHLLSQISSRGLDLQSNPQLRSMLISEAQRRGFPTGNL